MSKLLLVLAFAAIAAVAVSAQGPLEPVRPGQVVGNPIDLPPNRDPPSAGGNGGVDTPPSGGNGGGDSEYPKPIKVTHYRKGARHTHNHREEPLPKPVIKQRKYPLVKPKKADGPRTPRGLWNKPKNSTLKPASTGKKVKARIVGNVKRIVRTRPAEVHVHDHFDVHDHDHHHHEHDHDEYDYVEDRFGHHVATIPHHGKSAHGKNGWHHVSPPLVIGNIHDDKKHTVAPLHEHLTNAHDVHIHLGQDGHSTIGVDSAAATKRELQLIADVVDDHLRS